MPTIDPNIAILEFRPGPGGQESYLWLGDLLNMYVRFANKVGWKLAQIDDNIIKISGFDAYNQLKWETGTHRVGVFRSPKNAAGSKLPLPPLSFFPRSIPRIFL